jgi:phosphoribosyl 1,2-cyclic phosphodiesterase
MGTTTFTHVCGAAWPCSCKDPLCPSCNGVDVPGAGWGNTSFSLIVGCPVDVKLHLVVDAGSGCCRSIQAARLPAPSVLFVTHGHLDHQNLMELDMLRVMARSEGLGPIQIVATRPTWDRLPEFLKEHFRFIEAVPHQTEVITVNGITVNYRVLDASDHFVGGVMYVIEAEGLRHGFLFDKKSWKQMDLAEVESLDFAFLEANTIRPMSSRTGHVSLAEGLEMLRKLKRPPRAAFMFHYGHDEPDRLTLGNRILHLANIAPDLCVRWAYPGMTVSSRYLPPRNSVAVLDAETNLVVDGMEKSVVHTNAILHAAVSVICSFGDGKVLAHLRDSLQDQGDRWDVNRGHMQPWSNPLDTAFREACEEVRLFSESGLRLGISKDWLRMLSDPFEMRCDSPFNQERGSLIGLTIPVGVRVEFADERKDGTEVRLRAQSFTLGELGELSRSNPNRIADGLGRVLERIERDGAFRALVEAFLNRQFA